MGGRQTTATREHRRYRPADASKMHGRRACCHQRTKKQTKYHHTMYIFNYPPPSRPKPDGGASQVGERIERCIFLTPGVTHLERPEDQDTLEDDDDGGLPPTTKHAYLSKPYVILDGRTDGRSGERMEHSHRGQRSRQGASGVQGPKRASCGTRCDAGFSYFVISMILWEISFLIRMLLSVLAVVAVGMSSVLSGKLRSNCMEKARSRWRRMVMKDG